MLRIAPARRADLGVRLQVADDELAVAVLRRQRVGEPHAVGRQLRPLDRLPGVVDVVGDRLLGGRLRDDRRAEALRHERDGEPAATATSSLFIRCSRFRSTSDLRTSVLCGSPTVLTVDRLVLVGHLERRAAGDQHPGHRLDRHRHAHAGLALVAADDVDAARPERRRLRQLAFDARQLAVAPAGRRSRLRRAARPCASASRRPTPARRPPARRRRTGSCRG